MRKERKFIYDLNRPYLRVTAFSNISVMTRNYLIELFGEKSFPNGECVINHRYLIKNSWIFSFSFFLQQIT